MRSPSFYQRLLDDVSRSFALCIPRLDPPFRDQVSLAYLLLRVLDTVEDAPFTDRRLHQLQFDRLRGFLLAMPAEADLAAFVAAFPPELVERERRLLSHTNALLEDVHGLPAAVREAIFRATDRMAEGMAAYTRRGSQLHLIDVEDVARYACFVAGLVAEMLTELWALANPEPPPSLVHAYHFGLFLQKVNILKDQCEDEAEGRFLVPDRAELLASLGDDAHGALEYLKALPSRDRGYRTFCAWCVMMGAATVATLDEPKRSRRSATAALLAHTAAIVDDNAALVRQFSELMPALPVLARRAPLAKPESVEWFREALVSPLGDAELERLGVLRLEVATSSR